MSVPTNIANHQEIPEDNLADFTRDRRILTLSLMSVFIGASCSLIAYILVSLIALINNLTFFQTFSTTYISPEKHHLGYLVILIPALGGLIIGLMARYGSEKIRGHGIPEALEAILIGRSRMQPLVAILKPLSSAISIGTGGPFGAEGPIIMTGGAFGSIFAQMFNITAAERKALLVAGAAAGMSAIFATPVAAVLLAVELLLFEWKPRSFIPVAIAAGVAGSLRIFLFGKGPIFPVIPHGDATGEIMLFAIMAGIIAGLASCLLTSLVYAFEDLFLKLPMHWMWWPVIGGLVVGIGGIIDPRVLGVGYDTIHSLLRGDLIGMTLISLLLVKALVWSFSLGSGTSGGVLAPLLIMGGALGALEAKWIPVGDAGLWAMIGMAAIMGGTMRSPITAIIFTLELTHDLNILPALLLGCVAAHTLTVLLMRRSILTEKVARRGYHITREYTVDPLTMVRVGEVMDKDLVTLPASMKVSELSDLIAAGDKRINKHQALPVVDNEDRVVAIITRGDVIRALETKIDNDMTIREAGSSELVTTYVDELLETAVDKMLRNNIGRLLVVDRKDHHRLVGYLGRSSVMAARLRRFEEEQKSGWMVNPAT